MSPVEWYYAHGDQKAGPVPSTELKQLATAGELLPDDLVWREGMQQWVAARNVKGLFEETVPKPEETVPTPEETVPTPEETPPETAEPFANGFQPVSPIPATAPDLLPKPGQTALDRPRPRAGRHPLDVVLDGVRAQFPAEFVDSTTKIFVTGGHYCLYVAMLASFGVALALGIRIGSFDPVLLGVVWLLSLAVLQYAAGRSCVALDRLNRTTAGNVSTTVFLDSLAVLNMVAGLAILLWSAAVTIDAVLAGQSGAFSLVLFGLVAFIVCEYVAFVSLHPETLSVSVVPEAQATDEAIGVLAFLLKAMLRLAPVAFGAGVVCATIWLFCACYLAFVPLSGRDAVETFLGAEKLTDLEAAADPDSVEKMLEIWPAQETASTATWWIIGFAALPFVTYILFLLAHSLLDVIRAVLSIPARLEALAEGEEEGPGE